MLLPKRLGPGSTVGLVSPAGAMYEAENFAIATENLEALGLRVVHGPHLQARRGYLAGTDEQRAADLNHLFAHPDIDGIIAMRGGYGSARLLPLLDFEALARHPKVFCGFSDITALLLAVYKRTGLVTFHGPVANGPWNTFTASHFRQVVMEGQAPLLQNPPPPTDLLAPTQDRIRTLRPGIARGTAIGGNLTVLTSLVGSPFLPDFEEKILFLEDVGEQTYRIDRMLMQLRLAGLLNGLAGVVLGKFTDCAPAQQYGSLTLEEVFCDHLLPLNVPVMMGTMIGHIASKFTIPIGLPIEIDASRGTIQLLSPAVQ